MKKDKNSNILRATLSELEKSGFIKVLAKKDRLGNIEPPIPKSLLCLTEKSQDLWAELSEIDIKNSKVNAEKNLILVKK